MRNTVLDAGFHVLFEGRNFARLLQGLGVSLTIAGISLALSIVLGVILGWIMTHKNPVIQVLTRIYLEFVRIMPQLVLLFVVYFGFARSMGINMNGVTAAVIVFTIWGTAEMGDLVRGAIGSIPKHQFQSAAALGLSQQQTARYVVLPQTARQLLPQTLNLATRMIMTTSLVVLIGVVEVLKTGQQIIDANRFRYPDAALWVYGAIFLLYFAACWPLSLIARYLERKWNR